MGLKIKSFSKLFLLILVLFAAGCVATKTANFTDVQVDDLEILAGTWTGSLKNNGTPIKTKVEPNGSWSNKVKGDTYIGEAKISDGKVIAESFTTGGVYYWLVEENEDFKIIKWSDIKSGKIIATMKQPK